MSRTYVLLVWRARAEIEGGSWALVGGYVDPGDTVVQTVHNETWQEAAKRVGSLALFRIVDNPSRRNEPAENISHVFVSTVPDQETYGIVEVDDPDRGVQHAQWFALDALPTEEEMAFDHRRILAEYQADPTTYPLSIFMSGEQPATA